VLIDRNDRIYLRKLLLCVVTTGDSAEEAGHGIVTVEAEKSDSNSLFDEAQDGKVCLILDQSSSVNDQINMKG